MTHPTKIAIVGAGGIGCHLAPILSRQHDIVLVDRDSYEPKNVERQFPALKHQGNKARVLAELLGPHTLHGVEWIDAWLDGPSILNNPAWEGVDMIFGCVDNNESRAIICDVAEMMDCPAVLAGNSHEHGEAHLFVPGFYHPFEHFEFPIVPHTAPWGCNSDKVLEEFPQTPIANFLAAGCAMHILLSWKTASKPENAICYSRSDAFFGEFKRVRDLDVANQPAAT